MKHITQTCCTCMRPSARPWTTTEAETTTQHEPPPYLSHPTHTLAPSSHITMNCSRRNPLSSSNISQHRSYVLPAKDLYCCSNFGNRCTPYGNNWSYCWTIVYIWFVCQIAEVFVAVLSRIVVPPVPRCQKSVMVVLKSEHRFLNPRQQEQQEHYHLGDTKQWQWVC